MWVKIITLHSIEVSYTFSEIMRCTALFRIFSLLGLLALCGFLAEVRYQTKQQTAFLDDVLDKTPMEFCGLTASSGMKLRIKNGLLMSLIPMSRYLMVLTILWRKQYQN